MLIRLIEKKGSRKYSLVQKTFSQIYKRCGQISQFLIGGKIKTLPQAQYMGLLKLKKKDYNLSMKFYKKLKNPKIDMTSFLNSLIRNKVIKLGFFLTKKFWYEIDTPKDLYSLKKIKIDF